MTEYHPESIKAFDWAIVQRIQSGEKEAFGVLVARYQFRVARLVRRYIQDEAEIFDVVQEVFIRAFKALDHFRGESAFYSWLYRIAINTAKNHLITQGRRVPDLDIDYEETQSVLPGDSSLETPETLSLRDETESVILRVVSELPEELQTVLVLREVTGLSYEDIARLTETPVGTVRSRLHRARESVFNELKAESSKRG